MRDAHLTPSHSETVGAVSTLGLAIAKKTELSRNTEETLSLD